MRPIRGGKLSGKKSPKQQINDASQKPVASSTTVVVKPATKLRFKKKSY